MLYETLNQPYLFLIFLLVGFFCGFIFDLGNLLKYLCNNKKIANTIIDFFQTSLMLIIVFFVNLKVNYGLFRLYPYIIVITFFCLQRLFIGKMVAKFYMLCYTSFIKNIQKKHRDETNKNG